jgi:hypothetical protein
VSCKDKGLSPEVAATLRDDAWGKRLVESVSPSSGLPAACEQRVQSYGTAVVSSVYHRGGDELG